ncbi:MAG: ubiquitin-like domain-containing protein [Chloroflexi bacterium]|nr:ubiquitin-like domain-containing protein [Chloroflexota bacterium]
MNKNPPRDADTQPHPAVRRSPARYPARGRHWLLQRGRWLFSAVIAFTSCTLVFTLALFVQAIPTTSVIEPSDLDVSIQYGGSLRRVTTSALTVGELLAEQGIDLPAAEALSPAASERLRDGMVVTVLQTRSVTIMVGGIERVIQTSGENPLAILREAGIAVSDADKIWVNGALAHYEALPDWTVPALNIRIRRAAALTIDDDGALSTLTTTAETVGDALFAAGVSLYLTDHVTPPLDSPVSGAMTIHIDRAVPVVLRVDGLDIDARTNAGTVADLLAELHAPLFGLDYVKPAEDTAVTEGLRIEIVRVDEELVVESETIKHSLQYRPDANLNLDARAEVQAGRDGRREIRYRVRYENGIEVSRVHIETIEVEAPVNRIIAYGTNIIPLGTVQTSEGPRQYWRRLCVYVTSYNPESNGGNLNTSTGENLRKGVIAAKPNIIPYYTELYVPGYGLGTIYDTGGGPSGTDYWIDLGYGHNDGFKNWRAYLWVYLLWPPPRKVPYRLPAWTPNSNWPRNCG